MGHFVMCDLLNENGALRHVYNERADENFDEEADDVFGLTLESFADLFASQVASAVNYPDLEHYAVQSETTEYCENRHCLERNYRGEAFGDNDEYRAQILRWVGIFHDSLDTAFPWRGTPNESHPTNADGWTVVGLADDPVFLGGGGGEDVYDPDDEDDDRILLPGEAIPVWMSYAAPLLQGSHPRIALRRAMAQTMEHYTANWCDICQLFGLHEPGLDGATVQEVWEQCAEGNLNDIVGPPPQADRRIDAATCTPCGEGEASDQDGVCFFCDPDERKALDGPDCVQCADGEIALPDQTCSLCLDTQITVGNTCVDCPSPQHANRATNTCEGCPIDALVDASAFDGSNCGDSFFDFQSISPPGDICPNEFWLEIQNIDALAASGSNPSDLSIEGAVFSSFGPLFCGGTLSFITQRNFRDAAAGPAEEVFFYFDEGNICGGSSRITCYDQCLYDFRPMQTISAQDIEDTGLRSMSVRLTVPTGVLATHADAFVIAHDLCPFPF
jgi:hypothetical protein